MPVIDLKKLPSGEGLPDIADLPGCNVSLPVNHKHLFDFLFWCYKRHDAWRKRRAGVPREQSSDDPIIALKKSGNVVRELDEGSTFIKSIVREGKQDAEEIFCELEHARNASASNSLTLLLSLTSSQFVSCSIPSGLPMRTHTVTSPAS